MKDLFKWPFIIILCLTLGLAPFFPEPHLWGKIKWVAGGAKGMTGIDWFDLLFHGFPFVLLILKIIFQIKNKTRSEG